MRLGFPLEEGAKRTVFFFRPTLRRGVEGPETRQFAFSKAIYREEPHKQPSISLSLRHEKPLFNKYIAEGLQFYKINIHSNG